VSNDSIFVFFLFFSFFLVCACTLSNGWSYDQEVEGSTPIGHHCTVTLSQLFTPTCFC